MEVNAKTEVDGKPNDATPPQETVPTFVMRADSQTDQRLLREVAEDAPRVVEEVFSDVPTFTLRADQAGHLRALMAALHELPEKEKPAVRKLIREFTGFRFAVDLFEEFNR
jgi:hypothetical protein